MLNIYLLTRNYTLMQVENVGVTLRNRLDAASTTVRDFDRWFAREAGNPVVPDARPWTPTSPCRLLGVYPPGGDNDDDDDSSHA